MASNFAADTTTNWRWAYHKPLRHLVMTSPAKATDRLWWLLDNPAGSTWTPGQFYVKHAPEVVIPQADDAALAAQIWDRSTALVGLDAAK